MSSCQYNRNITEILTVRKATFALFIKMHRNLNKPHRKNSWSPIKMLTLQIHKHRNVCTMHKQIADLNILRCPGGC